MKNSIQFMLAATLLSFAAGSFLNTSSAFAQDIEWQEDLESAITKAEADNKLVLMHFTAPWCRPCQALEKFVFPNLEVARSVNEHVVAVRIDVDNEKSLVTEYGVTAVPFDVIITPGGRMIAKQKSPLDSNGYQRMMAGLSTPVKDLEDKSSIAVAQKLNEFSNQFDFKPTQLAEFKDQTPEAPSHVVPTTSPQSAQLARRKNRVANPFFGSEKTESKNEQVKVSNSFAAVSNDLDKSNTARTVSNDFAIEDEQGTSGRVATEGVAKDFVDVTGSEQVELEPPTINSDFQDITGAEQEQAFVAKQKTMSADNANASPQLSFQSPGPQLNQLMQDKKGEPINSDSSAFAAKVTPKQVQQDRFFQTKAKVDATQFNQTRVVAPGNSAQALLKPIQKIAQRKATSNSLARVDSNIAQQPADSLNNDSAFAVKTQRTAGAQVQKLLQPQQPTAVEKLAAGKPALALRGKCPVSLLQESKWVDGDKKFGCIHRDRLYMFADAEKLDMFRKNPDFYSPVLAGYDPVIFHKEGKLVDGVAEHGVFMGKAPSQQILLFKDAQTRALFQKDPTAYMNTVRQAMNATSKDNDALMR